MGLDNFLKQFDWSQLAFLLLFALPGFISLQIWALIVPSSERSFSAMLPEAIGFGVLNAMVAAPLVVITSPANPWALYLLLLLTLVGFPALWPFLVKASLQWLYRKRIILNPARNGWDAAFLRREPYFVIVHLKDGRRIGGYYGYGSYAGVYPASGHIYLESIWTLDTAGKFEQAVEGSKGMILRPDDYHLVELFRPDSEQGDGRQAQF